MLNWSCISRTDSALSWYITFFVYCWVQFAHILLKIYASVFVKNISLWGFLFLFFFSCTVFVLLWFRDNTDLKNKLVEAVKSGSASPAQVPLFISVFIIGSSSEHGLSSAVRMAQISV